MLLKSEPIYVTLKRRMLEREAMAEPRTADGLSKAGSMRIARIAVIASVLAGFGVTGEAQSRDDNWSRCLAADADISVQGCTAVIESGAENNTNLASHSNYGAMPTKN